MRSGVLLSTDDHVVVTGGARGITAHLMQDLIQNSEARFTLIGRNREIEGWIQELNSDRVKYLSLDVANKELVESQKTALADCTLLVHAAGIEVSKNFKDKDRRCS